VGGLGDEVRERLRLRGLGGVLWDLIQRLAKVWYRLRLRLPAFFRVEASIEDSFDHCFDMRKCDRLTLSRSEYSHELETQAPTHLESLAKETTSPQRAGAIHGVEHSKS